jgi:hypothetical protein
MNKLKKQKYEYVHVGDWVRDSDEYHDPVDRKWKISAAIGAAVNHPRNYRRRLPAFVTRFTRCRSLM